MTLCRVACAAALAGGSRAGEPGDGAFEQLHAMLKPQPPRLDLT